MNPVLLAVTSVLAVLQVVLPRAWAFAPLIVAACHTPYTPFAAGLTCARIIILIGLLRALRDGWFSLSAGESRDRMMLVFAVLAIGSTLGHSWEYDNPLTVRVRLVFDVLGTFVYAKAYLPDNQSLVRMASVLALSLVPFVFMMALEKQTGRNPYVYIGASKTYTLIREGGFRPQGPFGTPILAGTAGASAVPLMILLWQENRRLAVIGLTAALSVVFLSASSGPIGTTVIGLVVIAGWRFREHLRLILGCVFAFLFIINFAREKPIWYLMSLIDFVGGSTGWHRAYLIDVAVKHLDDWWLIGTDFTRHWMPYALANVANHCDITNYYLYLGVVIGGLPLMLCLVVIIWKTFSLAIRTIGEIRGAGTREEFRLWCFGAALLAHSITFLSISYFDQMAFFFWLLIGGAAGFVKNAVPEEGENELIEPAADPRAGWVGEWAPGLYRRQ